MKSKADGRRRTAEQQEVIRQQAVAAVLTGMKQVEATRVFGVTPTAMSLWMKKVKSKGVGSLKAKKRGGHKPGLLKCWQASWVTRTIRDSFQIFPLRLAHTQPFNPFAANLAKDFPSSGIYAIFFHKDTILTKK
jgi:hypothetical protein